VLGLAASPARKQLAEATESVPTAAPEPDAAPDPVCTGAGE